MTDWSRERWRKLYVREPLEQRAWGVCARGLRDYFIRVAEDDGYLAGDVPALLKALNPLDQERELTEAAIRFLLEDGFLVGEDGIRVRNLPAAQGDSIEPPASEQPAEGRPSSGKRDRASSAERQRRYRERVQERNGPSRTPSPPITRDGFGDALRDVTRDVTRDISLSPLPSPSEISSQITREERVSESPRTHAGGVTSDENGDASPPITRDEASPVTDVTNREAGSRCPLDIVQRAERLGVLKDLADALNADPEAVRASAEEFAGYWTIGAGAGKPRPFWMNKLREHVRRSAGQGKLPSVDAPTAPRGAAKALRARVEAQRSAHHAKLAAELNDDGVAQRPVSKLLEGIGG
jgi:hypothetical protein